MAPAMPAPNKIGVQKLDTVTDDDATRSHALAYERDDHEEKNVVVCEDVSQPVSQPSRHGLGIMNDLSRIKI
jgi:hypothetical protein